MESCVLNAMDRADTAWVAGILEGEGWFGWNNTHRPRRTPIVNVTMTDLDILERLQAVTGVGHICAEKLRDRCKQSYRWRVSKSADAWLLMEAVRPWMGARRGSKIDLMLEAK